MREKIKKLRTSKDMTLEQFADFVGTRCRRPDKWYLQRVQRIERGDTKVTDEIINDICKAFDIEVWQLMADDLTDKEKRAIERWRGLDDNESEAFERHQDAFFQMRDLMRRKEKNENGESG